MLACYHHGTMHWPSLTEFAEWVRRPRYAVVIAALTGALLFLPSRVLEYFAVCEIAMKYRGPITLIFAAALFLIATYPAEWLFRSCASAVRGWRHRRKLESAIVNVSADELPVLVRYHDTRNSTLLIPNYEVATAQELVQKGLLRRAEYQQRPDGKYHALTDQASAIVHSSKFQKLLLKRDPRNR